MANRRLKPLLDAVAGAGAIGLIRTFAAVDRKAMANLSAAVMRKVGPRFKEHRLGRANLRAAFPDKSDAEIENILLGVWDNLARVAVEFAHLDEFCIDGFPPRTRDVVTYAPETLARLNQIRDGGKSTILFGAHLANWEIPGLAAKRVGLNSAMLYRRPNIKSIADTIVKLREPLMGELVPTNLGAPVKLARLLESGIHVGMVADQHYTHGTEVTFFGRPCLANPLVALLARQTGAPIRGMHVVRQPDGNSFWGELTEPIEPTRDADGKIDIRGTTQAITSVIEGWVRAHPEQWLWLHRRWK